MEQGMKNRIMCLISELKEFSLPQLQASLGLTYKKTKDIISELIDENLISFEGGITYRLIEKSVPDPREEKPSSNVDDTEQGVRWLQECFQKYSLKNKKDDSVSENNSSTATQQDNDFSPLSDVDLKSIFEDNPPIEPPVKNLKDYIVTAENDYLNDIFGDDSSNATGDDKNESSDDDEEEIEYDEYGYEIFKISDEEEKLISQKARDILLKEPDFFRTSVLFGKELPEKCLVRDIGILDGYLGGGWDVGVEEDDKRSLFYLHDEDVFYHVEKELVHGNADKLSTLAARVIYHCATNCYEEMNDAVILWLAENDIFPFLDPENPPIDYMCCICDLLNLFYAYKENPQDLLCHDAMWTMEDKFIDLFNPFYSYMDEDDEIILDWLEEQGIILHFSHVLPENHLSICRLVYSIVAYYKKLHKNDDFSFDDFENSPYVVKKLASIKSTIAKAEDSDSHYVIPNYGRFKRDLAGKKIASSLIKGAIVERDGKNYNIIMPSSDTIVASLTPRRGKWVLSDNAHSLLMLGETHAHLLGNRSKIKPDSMLGKALNRFDAYFEGDTLISLPIDEDNAVSQFLKFRAICEIISSWDVFN